MKNIVKENPITSGIVIALLALLIWGWLIELFIKIKNREINSLELSNKSFHSGSSEKNLFTEQELVKLDVKQSPTDYEKVKGVIKTNRVFINRKGVSNKIHEKANQLTQLNQIEEVKNPFFDPEGAINDYESELDNEEYNKWDEKAGERLKNLFSKSDYDDQNINSVISLVRYRKDSQVSAVSDE